MYSPPFREAGRVNTLHRTSSSRFTGGFFIPAIFPGKTYAGLTTELASSLTQKKIIDWLAIVNNNTVSNYHSTSYKNTILLSVKPALVRVNKINILPIHDL